MSLALDEVGTLAPFMEIRVPASMRGVSGALLSERLLNFRYEDSADKPPLVQLRFSDPDQALMQPETLAIGLNFRLRWGYANGFRVADVTMRYIKEIGGSDRVVILEGRPTKLDRLMRGTGWDDLRTPSGAPVVEVQENVRDSDIARLIALAMGYSEAGLADTIHPTEPVHAQRRLPRNVSPAVYLYQLARANNYNVIIGATRFYFWPTDHGREPPRESFYAFGHRDVLEYNLENDLTLPRPYEVRRAAWDPTYRVVVEHRVPDTEDGRAAAAREAAGGVSFRPAPESLRAVDRGPSSSPAKARQAAQAAHGLLKDRTWKLRLRLRGHPLLDVGQWITCRPDFGPWTAGDWYVRGVQDEIGEGGYTTEITEATRRAPGAGSGRARPRYRPAENEGDAAGGVVFLQRA